jgi:hypothetical protein
MVRAITSDDPPAAKPTIRRMGFVGYELPGDGVTSDEALGTYGAVDCGAYVANFLLAA